MTGASFVLLFSAVWDNCCYHLGFGSMEEEEVLQASSRPCRMANCGKSVAGG